MSSDQAELPGQEVDGPDAAGCDGPGPVGDLVVDVGGGHHRLVAFDAGLVLDAAEDSPPAFAKDPAVAFPGLLALCLRSFAVVFSGLLGESSSHSKVSVVWNSEEVFLPQLFQKLRGFSSFFRDSDAEALYITLG